MSEVQALQLFAWQSWPPQSALEQQLPAKHAPLQHFSPVPHWASPVQVLQEPFAHTCPLAQSALLQQLPALHRFPPVAGQHTEPAPQSPDELQLPQTPLTQARPPPPQSLFLQQLPTWQPPLQQTSPPGQLEVVVQEVQEFATQGWLPPQSALVQQVPLTQKPEQHFWLVPHWLSMEHAVHALLTQS